MGTRHPLLFGLTVASASLATTTACAQEATPSTPPAWETAPATRRTGFIAGFSGGFGIGSIVGYPNDPTKIGYARYYTVSGVRPLSMGTFWIGGALADWFNFGFGFAGGNLFATGDNKAGGGGILFRIEGYPLFSLGGKYRDLGVLMDAGFGGVTIAPKDDPMHKLVDSGSASIIGGGVFYDGLRFWRFGSGPFVEGLYSWSSSVREPILCIGFRTALYAGKITK